MDALYKTILNHTKVNDQDAVEIVPEVDPSRFVRQNRPLSSNKQFGKVTAKGAKQRGCLKCRKSFQSSDVGNRICSSCKLRIDTYSLPSCWDISLT